MNRYHPRHFSQKKSLISGRIFLALVGVVIVTALSLAFGAYGRRSTVAKTSHPSSPEEWEEGGYADFVTGMAGLYTVYDVQERGNGPVTVVGGVGSIVYGEDAARDMEVLPSDDGLRANAWGLLESLGYACTPEGEGFRASNQWRGDEVLVLPDSVEVNGIKVDAGVGTGEQGLTVDVARLGEALGYEVLSSDEGRLTLQDPWETARVVTMGNPEASDSNALEVVSGPNGIVVLQYGTVREAREAAERLLESGEVTWTGPDRIARICESGTDWAPASSLSWGNDYIGTPEMQMSLVAKYGSIADVPEVVVAVVDTGVDLDHELFAGRLVDGYDFADDDNDPNDTNKHGTHVSGIVVNNTAENVKVMPLRAGAARELSETAIYSSIEYAISHGADVINMSFGGEYGGRDGWFEGSIEQQAIRDAEQAGIVLVGAHGNDFHDSDSFFPSSDDAVISVSAIDEQENLAHYSNYGTPIDLCAPGTSIYSALLDGAYGYESGTSMAAPFVSAASALVLGDDATRSSAVVRQLLQDNARDLGQPGWDKYYGYGCVDLSQLTDKHFAARIGAQGFDSFQAAYDAAVSGDEIILLEDVELTSTFVLAKDVTIRSSRSQVMSLAEGSQLPMLTVTGNVTLGDSENVGRSLIVSAPGQYDASSLVAVGDGGTLRLKSSAVMRASVDSEAIIQSDGALVVSGATIKNASSSGTCVQGTGDVTLDGCEIVSAAEGPSVVCSGALHVDGQVGISDILLSNDAHITMGNSIPRDLARIGIVMDDPSEGRLVIALQGADEAVVPPFYLTDTSWKLAKGDSGYVLTRAAAYDARIGEVTYESLIDAVSAAQDGDTVVVCRDVLASETLVISGRVSLSSDGENALQASPELDGPLMVIPELADLSLSCPAGSSLELNGLWLDRASSLVEVSGGGRLVLGENAAITGYRAIEDEASPVHNAGDLLIDGAVVTDNVTHSGGGVYNDGTMELRSGEISGNVAQHSGGGVINTGSLLISGGHVDDNETTDAISDADGTVGTGLEAQGGGVWNSGSLTLTNGTITGNHSDCGGGVYNSGSFNMTGGTVARNNAHVIISGTEGGGTWAIYSGEGGGVYTSGLFNMAGGLLSENNALSRGGGVSVPGGEMTLSGGEIVDNTIEGHGYYTGAGGATFFRAHGIYSRGGELKLDGGSVKSSVELADEVLISSYMSTEVSGDFKLEGGMLWASNHDNTDTVGDGLPIKVKTALSTDIPIKVFSVNYAADTVIVTYDDGVQPDVTDFALGDFGPNVFIYSGEDTLRVEDQSLVLTRPHEIVASEGWERNGTCEQRIDENGRLTIRPINGVWGMLRETFVYNNEIVQVVIEKGVSLPNASALFLGCSNLETVDLRGLCDVINASSMFLGCNSLNSVLLPDLSQLQLADYMFYGCASLTEFDDTPFASSPLTSASCMFNGCTGLVSIDLSHMNTVQLTNTSSMFSGCSSLVDIDCSDWNTSHLANAICMYHMCTSLESLDLSGWDTSQLEDMQGMFNGCTSLSSLNLTNWDTSSVRDMSTAFASCGLLTSLDVSEWDTSHVTDMNGMFNYCTNLETLDVSSWDTSSVTSMANMFGSCNQLADLNPSGWNTSSVKDMSELFSECSSVTHLDLSGWDTSSVTNMTRLFSACVSLESVDVAGWDTSSVRDMTSMFGLCSSLESLDLSSFNTSSVKSFAGFLSGCTKLADLDLGALDTSSATSLQVMFSSCRALTSLDVSSFDTANVKNATGVFTGCSSLEALDLSMWDTSSVARMESLFQGCSSLVSVNLTGWQTGNVSSFADVFRECSSIRVLELSKWQTASVRLMDNMFSGCSSLTTLDVSGWDTSHLESAEGMFYGCESLSSLDVSGWNASSLANTSYMFTYCKAMNRISIPSTWPLDHDDALPMPTACNGKWWSTSDAAWYSNEDIVANRNGIADTYTNPNGTAGHKAGEAVHENEIPATCMSIGSYDLVSRCEFCGKVVTIKHMEDAPLGHDEGVVSVENELVATCTEAGSYDSVTRCGRCGDVLSSEHIEVEPLGHDYVATVVEPTADEGGYTLHTCSRCDDEYVSDETPSLNVAAAQAVNDLITELPEYDSLSLSDAAAVSAARSAYDALTADQKALVTGLADLQAAEARIAELVAEAEQATADRAAAAGVDAAILAIPALEDLTLGDGPQVAAARSAYDALTDAQKAFVSNLPALEAAEARTAELQAIADQQAADLAAAEAVDAKVAALPNPDDLTLEDAASVTAARAAYEALTEAQRALVTRLATLEAAEARIVELRAMADQQAADEAAARGVDAAIAALPELDDLTLGDATAVVAARDAYDALTEAQMALVQNLAELEAAEARVAELQAMADQQAADRAAADAFDAMVGALPATEDLTLEDAAFVSAARAAYDALTEARRAYAEGLPALEAAEARIAELVAEAEQADRDRAAAAAVDQAIMALPPVDALVIADAAAVQAARASYEALTEAQRALVTRLAALEAAEARIAELRVIADQQAADLAAAQAVDARIQALPGIDGLTLEDAASVTAARAAFDALTEAQKLLVTQLAALESAEARIAELSEVPTDLSSATVTVAGATYTGTALTPKVTVTLGEAALAEGTDYEVVPGSYVAAGSHEVSVRGIGGYAGTATGTFKVSARAISKATVAAIANRTYTGSAIKPAPTVKDGTRTLRSGTDYTVAYKNNVKAGTATITIKGKGNYSGSKSVTFKIAAASVAKATVSKIANQKYDGRAKTPRPTVKVGTRTLKLNTDYTLTYKNNTKAGTATVTIKGKGNYSGSKSVTFKIVAMAGTWKGSGSRWWYSWKDGTYPKSVFLDISGKTYYFNSSGYCVYGWQKISGKYYYFDGSGAMARSRWVGNYWLQADGTMATSKWVDGGRYYVGADGVWVKGKTK